MNKSFWNLPEVRRKSHYPLLFVPSGISEFRETRVKCFLAVTPSQKRQYISMTSNLMFTFHYFNNLSVTQKNKIPSSLDVIFEWQKALGLPPPTPSPWVSNEAEASMTVLCTNLSSVMVSAETGSPLQRAFAWELVQNNPGKVLTVWKCTCSHQHLTMMTPSYCHLQADMCFLLLHTKMTSDSSSHVYINKSVGNSLHIYNIWLLQHLGQCVSLYRMIIYL